MFNFGNKEFRILEEQVQQNLQDIQDFKDGNQTIAEFGITVVGILSDASQLPEFGENYGDAYLIGTKTPYDMRVWTRDVANNTARWVDLGQFPLAGPKGDKGDIGSIITAGQGEPSNNPTSVYQYYINTVTGYWYKPQSTPDGFVWVKSFSLKGEKGDRGEQGKQGVQGPKGDTGAIGPIGLQGIQGERGPVGPAFNVQGTIASTSNLPTPTAEMQDKGYAYLIADAEGVKHVWVIQGPEGGPFQWVDIGAAGVGVQGPAGTNGIGLNTLTDTNLTLGDTTVQYSTDEGISINSTMRQTFDGTNHDSMVDFSIPVVGVDGITIDKADNAEKIEISGKNFVAKVTTSTPDDRLYGITALGEQSIFKISKTVPENGNIAQYTTGANLLVNDPIYDNSCTNKKYVEDNFVKIYKPTSGTYAYVCNKDNYSTTYRIAVESDAWTLVARKDGGRIETGDPVAAMDAVNLQYLNANALTANSVKTLFGNQSIIGSGNIDLYKHTLTIMFTPEGAKEEFALRAKFYSSKNLKIDSYQDLTTVLGDTFYESLFGGSSLSSTEYGIPLYMNNARLVWLSSTKGLQTTTWANKTITDIVTTV